MKEIGLLIIWVMWAISARAQPTDTVPVRHMPQWLQPNKRFVPEFKVMVQLWGIYAMGMEVYNKENKRYEPVYDRINLSFRRARLVVSDEPYPGLHYYAALFYDQIGRDLLASGVGGANRADPNVGIWDAFFRWKIAKGQSLNLVAGWFRPQMQRESITSGFSTTSFEKSMSQNYVRTHLVGTGPGRAMGLNLGGIFGKNKTRLNYNLGLFNPVTAELSGASAGDKFSPLWAGRLSLSLGDPEMKEYNISYDINYFNQRKGISLDFNASWQGETDLFHTSVAYGPGLLLNWGPLNFDGEWIWMQREAVPDSNFRRPTAKAGTGHGRLGINIPARRFVLEPIFMVMHLSGPGKAAEQADAAALEMPAGSETTYDAGINWYLDRKNLKLLLHYTWRTGDAGDAGDGSQVNMYFSQSGVGAIRRGNYVGMGLHAIF